MNDKNTHMSEEKTQLCRCNNCYTVMFDENPSDQPALVAPSATVNMKKFEEDGSSYWGCPECGTDETLMDITSEQMLEETIQK